MEKTQSRQPTKKLFLGGGSELSQEQTVKTLSTLFGRLRQSLVLGALQCREQRKWRTIAFQSLDGKSLSDLKGHLDRKLLTSHMNLLSGNIQVRERRRRVKTYTEGGKLDPACGKTAWNCVLEEMSDSTRPSDLS